LEPLSGSDLYNIYVLEKEFENRNDRFDSAEGPFYEVLQKRISAIKEVLDELYPKYFFYGEFCCHTLFESSKESFFKLET